jgi:hypothetical protein
MPHFVAVWRFQAWNLSYNVSAEFDDYRKRYEWVIEGIKFLQRGIRYNDREHRLISDVGWYIAQKIGRADERKQFRQLFKEDDDFHGTRPLLERDNWLVGKLWFTKAEELIDDGAPLGTTNPATFYAQRPMSQMNCSENRAEDGEFGDKYRRSWDLAHREWVGPRGPGDRIPLGDRKIDTVYEGPIHLNDYEKLKEKEIPKLQRRLDEELAPGIRDQINKERRAELTAEQLAAHAMPVHERTEDEHGMAFEVSRKLRITHEEVAERVTGGRRSEALALAKKLAAMQEKAQAISRYRQIVNFKYWRRRPLVERLPQASQARQLEYEGKEAFNQGRLNDARQMFDAGFAKWREVLDLKGPDGELMFPGLVKDGEFGRDWMDMIKMYRRILDARDEPFPEDFILQDALDEHKEPEVDEDEEENGDDDHEDH